MKLLIGIDDTDNQESRGTGFLSRKLAGQIEDLQLGRVNGITRHQLFVHPDIAYTSQNSSACLEIESRNFESLKSFCAKFLIEESAAGSDAGLCIANMDLVNKAIISWGKEAKKTVLTLSACTRLAKVHELFLQGLTGTQIGQIGALAAVGLRKSGNDGRFIWLKGTGELRDFDSGIYLARHLKNAAGIDAIQTEIGNAINPEERIFCNGWTRPILLNNMSVLLVEKTNFTDYEWKTIPKEYIRKIY